MTTQNAAPAEVPTFENLGLSPKVLALLAEHQFMNPTPIQHQAIPHAVVGKDVIGIAQTGTGKTLAFGLPLIQQLSENGGRALILAPTRELALQIEETIARFAPAFKLTRAVLIGGTSMNPQINALRNRPSIIIATPGRLLDHMRQRTIRLDDISALVLDEADRMLDMGFWPQIREIIAVVPRERQTMLFSATLSKEIMDLATKHMKLPVSIEVAPPGTTAERVSQEFFIVRKEDKPRLLEKVLTDYQGSTIIFTRTKHGAKKLARLVRIFGHAAAEIHSNRSLAQRREALDGFKSWKYRVLVATDIAARGIDVKDIELVINYDLPSQAADYVHRIGRTARAGKEGHAISFCEPAQKRDLRDIERLIRMPVPVSDTPAELPPQRAAAMQSHRDDEHDERHRGRGHGGRGRSFNSGDRRSPGRSHGSSSEKGRWHARTTAPTPARRDPNQPAIRYEIVRKPPTESE
ncbi:DEAD/DEAH box helicase [Candidatus Kaiserbacteria bacterium]|nr:DEAD/DEAH box helicase [Candidatus Kaiserbacteria bacterium]